MSEFALIEAECRARIAGVMKTISRENVIRTYGLYAPFYDGLFGPILEPGRRALMKAVSTLRPQSILEVGVGTGLTLCRYPPVSTVVGIDISLEMLEIARRRVSKLADRDIQLQAMDAEAMEFPDDHFDCVTIPYALSVTPDPDRLVAEIRRVCRKGGSILILNHFSGDRLWWIFERAVQSVASKIGFRSEFSLSHQILKHDWEVCSVTPVNVLGLSKLVAIRNR